VLDIPGGHGKVPIGPEYIDADGSVRDPGGLRHLLTLAAKVADGSWA
jgi:lysine 2,3-aminomutase